MTTPSDRLGHVSSWPPLLLLIMAAALVTTCDGWEVSPTCVDDPVIESTMTCVWIVHQVPETKSYPLLYWNVATKQLQTDCQGNAVYNGYESHYGDYDFVAGDCHYDLMPVLVDVTSSEVEWTPLAELEHTIMWGLLDEMYQCNVGEAEPDDFARGVIDAQAFVDACIVYEELAAQ